MAKLNIPNRTFAVMDNLAFLRAINSNSIDLIAIDPPFAANETFSSRPNPPLSDEEIEAERDLAEHHGVAHNEGIGETRVRDVWRWDRDIDTAWKLAIQYDHPGIHSVVTAVETCATENEAAYISYMAQRLIHCRRVLKRSGSIFVHCDDHANGYLRLLLDAIFGARNFRNELVWRRATSHNDARRFGRITDRILFYAKSEEAYWGGDTQRAERSEAEIKTAYPLTDERGRYRVDNMTGPGVVQTGESGSKWRRYDVTAMGRTWSVPRTGAYAEYIERNLIPGYRSIKSILARLEALDKAGMINHPKTGRWPGLKRYADADLGLPPQDLILNPTGFTNYSASAAEFMGYATQKPLALYEHLIATGSKPDDVVMDVFAGCATTAVAAERLGRQWIACDMAYRSWTMLKRRFYLEGFALEDTSDATLKALAKANGDDSLQTAQQFGTTSVIGPGQLPERDDPLDSGEIDAVLREHLVNKQVQTATWSGRIPKAEAKALLIDRFGHRCWGCGFEPRRPNGTFDDTLLEVDHIRARRPADGSRGNDELYNLALLHRTCNGIKRNTMTLEELRTHNEFNMMLYVDSERELVDLFEAQRFAMEHLLASVV